MSDRRPPIRIRFRFNIETGELEFIVDDVSPDRSNWYHDRVAQAIAGFLARNPEISDAGSIRYRLDQEWFELSTAYEQRQQREEPGQTLED